MLYCTLNSAAIHYFERILRNKKYSFVFSKFNDEDDDDDNQMELYEDVTQPMSKIGVLL